MKAYEALAAVYDRLGEKPNYDDYASFFRACCTRRGLDPELVLDLGCGTGAMTLAMADIGYDMIGVDGSAEMLSRAYERCYSMGAVGILFLNQDMREFELYGTVGGVVSTLDCINYLVEDGDLDKCFSLVHNYLDPDGIFLFDVNTPYKFDTVYGDNAYVLEDETSLCAWQNEYDRESGLCRFYLSIFEEGKDGRYTRADEEQTERCYTREQLTDALARAGFVDIEFYQSFQFDAPDERTERWYVVARCKK